MTETTSFLASLDGVATTSTALPDSAKRFPDGAEYRVEIPSVEGPRCLESVFAAADELGVVVHRVSQGSGVFLHTDEELREMASLASGRRVEMSLFARPGAAWGTSAMARAAAGAIVAATAWGARRSSRAWTT